jgi:hypothetical protein
MSHLTTGKSMFDFHFYFILFNANKSPAEHLEVYQQLSHASSQLNTGNDNVLSFSRL